MTEKEQKEATQEKTNVWNFVVFTEIRTDTVTN